MADNASPISATAASTQSTSTPLTREASNPHSTPRIRRRNRVIASCLECRRRKLKCDKQAPCINCTKFRRDCLYLASALDSASQQKLAEIKDQMGSLEQILQTDVARQPSSDQTVVHPLNNFVKVEEESDEEGYEENEDEQNLEPTPLASLDQVYDDDADDEVMDLGVQLGKMRVSDRIGGFVRPRMAQELRSAYPERRGSNTIPDIGQPSSPSRMPSIHDISGSINTSSYINPLTNPNHWLLADSADAFLAPGPEYIAPASSFFFPANQASSSILDYLPDKTVCDSLMNQYWRSVHPVVTTVHRPTFEKQYIIFWQHFAVGTEPPASMQAVIFAALFSAAVSLPEHVALQQYGVSRVSLMERLQSSTEKSLARAHFLRTTKLTTMQAFVMYLIPLCRGEISRAHSALTGTAIRLAECMGLHRDGTHYAFSPVEIHVRRLVWYQLCFLDIRTCEATGPRPQIHKDHFDTKLPLNLNEIDLMTTPLPAEDTSRWTDMTLSRIRFECVEMHRQCWADFPRIDQKKIKLTAVLAKIQKFKTAMEAKYGPILQDHNSTQVLTKTLLRILSSRLFIMLLHRYITGAVRNGMPVRLRQILIEACLSVNENTIAMETRPEMEPWAWYRGALQQYHSAMLLMMELRVNPSVNARQRMIKCIDYVFELPQSMTIEQKLDAVTFALRDRLQIYQDQRKIRASTKTETVLRSLSPTTYWAGATAPEPAQQPESALPIFDSLETEHMNPQSFASPPIAPSSSTDGVTPPSYNTGTSQSSTDIQMGAQDEIDWNEWDKYFPPDTDNFDMVDLPDFDMGSASLFPAPDYYANSMQGYGANSLQ